MHGEVWAVAACAKNTVRLHRPDGPCVRCSCRVARVTVRIDGVQVRVSLCRPVGRWIDRDAHAYMHAHVWTSGHPLRRERGTVHLRTTATTARRAPDLGTGPHLRNRQGGACMCQLTERREGAGIASTLSSSSAALSMNRAVVPVLRVLRMRTSSSTVHVPVERRVHIARPGNTSRRSPS
jgi:hypothetical protein